MVNCSQVCAGLVALVLAGGAAEAAERKLYKVVDAAGNVTYQDRAPQDESLQVEEKQFDPDTNVVQRQRLPRAARRAPAAPPPGTTAKAVPAGDDPQVDLRRAAGVLIDQGLIGPPPPEVPPPTPTQPPPATLPPPLPASPGF